MIFFPKGLSFEHLFGPLTHLTDPRVLGATALYVILAVSLLRGFRSSRRAAGFLLFGIAWFLITLSPTSSVFPTTATIAENRVYLPAIGMCLLIPFIGHALLRRFMPERYRRTMLIAALALYAVCFGYMTFRRNVLYQDPARIWSDVIQKYPNHERAHKNLALEFYKRGDFRQMAAESEKAVSLDPGDFEARNNLAAAYYNAGRLNEALAAYEGIVKEKPDFAPAYANLGLVYEQLKNIPAAIKAYENAIHLNPTLIEPLNNLGNIYLETGHRQEAAAMYEAALRIDPNNAAIRRNYEMVTRQ
jgi:tetratricopeptide (TPR) repeat protein